MNKYKGLFISLLLLAFQVQAKERIKHFHSQIEVKSSGDIWVTETIAVEVEHVNIKRGIYRDFPTLYKTALLTKSTVDFAVISVSRNGHAEPFHRNKLSNGVRLYIGDRNRMVEQGEQVYTISYKTNKQIAFMDDFDRFAWNVTGNDWRFSMDRVTAEVQLPDGVSMAMVNSGVWTGFAGETSADYSSEINGSVIKIQSTQPLEPYQGMTFSLEIPKGFIVNDSNWLMDFFSDNLMWVLMVVALLSLLMFYVLAWHQVGRDPEAGVIIPLFYPPKDISPAAMRYILEEETGHKNFTAAIINLAVKGYVELKKKGSGYEVTKRQTSGEKLKPMSSGESIIMRRLFKSRNRISIDKKYDAKIKTAINKVNSRIETEYKAKCFKDNKMLGYFGIGISVLTLLFLMLHLNVLNGEMFGGFAVLFVVAGYAIFTIHKSFKGAMDLGHLLFIGVFAFSLFRNMGSELPIEVILFGVFLILINGLFIYLLKSPTPFGREMMDDIEGFKLYLSTAEQHRLDVMHPPEMSPDLFEEYLPYAIALGVENKWSEQFANHLKSAGIDPNHSDYHPNWYSGGHFNLSGSSGGFSEISQGMASTISSASTPPSSSSGGGGGFSGGGGGGGGGGGW
ncbi:DUF2207 domain-containing protein [Marinicella litoralis]|uniref:Putative membrane protein n=1 Tax=Marinicella litoralis TaxID=644220 RepID=A0A4R6XAY4_9GAMM|nr:DUF2207 domain-containing protein [Marinicella litoralis]TDR16316.1 putative membrane protein [Marinicella litoralis]